ncbi:hypothetical protein XELAEV_18009805mg [Xenopus laevis]|uniref:Immunoglobulin V-set domain-containing protein n=1 Tax=Xenopus laevis TaxID=8355 RepID=A0A974I1D5_XENLA|nr:hypothetical protein XELAEV_18009805mg [Xenopus laevis]
MTPILATYCVLLWISYAESQTLSLTPSNNAVNLGERATLTCNIGAKDGSWVNLLKQIPGNVPQLIIAHHHSATSPVYGPGISTDRYNATINDAATEYQFIIKRTETADTAHYYCAKWFDSISACHSDKEFDKNWSYKKCQQNKELVYDCTSTYTENQSVTDFLCCLRLNTDKLLVCEPITYHLFH